VGFLELDPIVVNDMGHEVLPIDRVADLGSGDPNSLATLVGCSGESMILQQNGIQRGAIDSINLQPIAPDDYALRLEPLLDTAPPANSSRDVFLDYRGVDNYAFWTGRTDRFPAIPGMSGGGIWDWHRAPPDSLWQVDKTRLFAIQSSQWCDSAAKKPYLRATQIIYFLKLIYDYYPDVQSLLGARYPRIAQLGE
jgi:hypothetical protein